MPPRTGPSEFYAEENRSHHRGRRLRCCRPGGWTLLRNSSGVQYRTAAVSHGDINVAISATGNPNAVVTVQVGSQVSGIVMALYADFNTKVTKGQLIARLDPASLLAKVDEAQGNLDSARAVVANAPRRFWIP
jgi:HlyD family secretion protein